MARNVGIGLQLYTLRQETAQDFKATLAKVAALGYEGVEFAGYGGLNAGELKELLDELGLQAIGSHVSLKALREDLDGQIEYLKTIGGKVLICPYVAEEERRHEADWKALYAFLEQTGHTVRERGLAFAYHNHAFEFEAEVDGQFAFDAMYTYTTPAAVQVELDVCWVQYAGQDPLAYIRRYAGRLPLLHLKDYLPQAQAGLDTVELGRGIVDLQAVAEAAVEAGVEWLIVEQDNCPRPPLDSVAESMAWLRAKGWK
ncbi:sugar phosphate isomerase/epimerase family protein [Paenibacillus sp. y28]|uniref:sugar phosphate isomerase/epimerase family protein n=1 Tax=Paenibacillus sp. y28 TaxID=3129110 RepID=UPI00301700A5